MKTFIRWGLRLSISFYTLLHFFTYFFEIQFLLLLLSISGLFIILFMFLNYRITETRFPLVLCLFALSINLLTGNSIVDGLLTGIVQMRTMIGLLIIVPMVSWVLTEESYIESIINFAHNSINTSRKFYFGVIGFTQIITYFLLYGSIPMMYQFMNILLRNQKGEAWENFKGTALLRSFALSTMWVISIPSFVYAVESLGASLWASILQGFAFALLGSVLAVVFSLFQEKHYGVDLTAILQSEIDNVIHDSLANKIDNRHIFEFCFLFLSLFGTVFLLHGILSVDLMLIIPFVIIPWTFIYYFFKRKIRKLFNEIKTFFIKDTIKQSYQLSVLLAAGLVIYAFNQTNFGAVFTDAIYYIQGIVPFLNPLFLLPFILISLGFLGLGPLTAMVLVVGILENIPLSYPPELIVLVITSGSVISILLSPFTMPVIILSASNKLSAFKNGIQFNLLYAIVFYIIVQVYVQTILYL